MKFKTAPILPFLIIVLLPIIFFAQAVTGQMIIAAGDFTGSDLLDLHYAFKAIFSAAIRNGTLPLWTQYLSNGFPILAEGQTGIFYPINLLFSLLHPMLAINYSIIAVFMITGAGTYLYATRIFKDNKFSALFAAVIFMFSGFFVTRIKHLNLIAVASLFPWGLYFLHRFFEKLEIKWSVFLGITVGVMLLAGHPQMAFYCFFIYGLYLILEINRLIKKETATRVLPVTLIAILTAGIIGAGISAIQVLPTFELLRYTERLNYSFQTATAYPFHPKNLITLFSPYYFGNPATGSYREDIRTMGIFWENSLYIGILPFALSLYVLFNLLRKKEKDRSLILWTALGVFSLFIMLGKFTPLFRILWTYVPGFSLFRFPTRFNLFFLFALSLLAARGAGAMVDFLVKFRVAPKEKENQNDDRLTLSWPLDKEKTQWLLIIFVMVDLFVFGKNYVGFFRREDWLKKPEIVKFLEKDDSLYRTYSLSQYGESPYQLLGWKKDPGPILAMREALPPNNNAVYGIASFTDRGWFEGGLSFDRRNNLERSILSGVDQVKLSKLLGLFNIKYLITFNDVAGFEMERVKEIDLGEKFGTKVNVFENKQVMPRFYFVPEAKVITDQGELFENLGANDFYPRKTVLLEKNPEKLLPVFDGVLEQYAKDNSVKLNKYSDMEVVFETELKNDGYLVLSDTFYPGWKATVDGRKKEILPANYFQRALSLMPGKHIVRFYYDPLYFKIGAAISGLTFFGLASLAFYLLFPRHYKAHRDQKKRK